MTDLRVEVVHARIGIRSVGSDETVDVQVDHVFGGLCGRLPFLLVVDRGEERVAVLVDHALVEVVAVEERSEERRVGKECRSRWSS